MFTTVLVFGTLEKKFRQYDLRNVSFLFHLKLLSDAIHVQVLSLKRSLLRHLISGFSPEI